MFFPGDRLRTFLRKNFPIFLKKSAAKPHSFSKKWGNSFLEIALGSDAVEHLALLLGGCQGVGGDHAAGGDGG